MENFMARVFPDANSGCWLWEGYLTPKGYGRLRHGGAGKVLAHVLSYWLHVGRIPSGMELDHKCRLRCCVNPAHLEPVTHLVNMERGREATKTHCKHGHAYADGFETYHRNDKHGKKYRRCLTCYAARYPGTRKLENGKA
jgi:hypothetical protein